MFAPNRFLTTQEQWLLLGIVVAVLTGSITMYFYGRSKNLSGDPFLVEEASTHSVVPSSTREDARRMETVHASSPLVALQEQHSSPALLEPAVANMPEKTVINEQQPVVQEAISPITIGVAAMGAVRKPGLYLVPDTTRVADLISLAGGATESADLSEIFLTAPLIDETTLTIPEKPVHVSQGTEASLRRTASDLLLNPPAYLKRYAHAAGAAPAQDESQSWNYPQENTASALLGIVASGAGLINVNRASSSELQTLPGIGPALAEAIISERTRQTFLSVDDLDRVPGIGEKRLSAIRGLITAP
ncbi:MAG TPA: helix-hairpin-helix domain-containing protein [Candidatus Hydrogenedentes bacterium]|nr:MAG: ComE operon protein 1 [Candidatus Hydrogenedentes bacterium ADurb.Bin179]HOH28151.1 helix-hairpin-helix domain-containing protein [Candidatus Hydrogenedentota bacterium]